MNIEEPNNQEVALNPSIQLLQRMIQDQFSMLLKYQFIQEVYEEVMSQNPGELDDNRSQSIIARLFEILIAERIESLVDVEKQEPMKVRIYSTELDAGFLVSDNLFKIVNAVNVSQVKDQSKKNTENGCLKLTLSNGKEQLYGIEEGKIAGIPFDLELEKLEGFLIFVRQDTAIRRGIIMLSGLCCFVFDSMDRFTKEFDNMMARIEKAHKEQELLKLQQEQRERQLQQEQERLRQRESQMNMNMNMDATTQGTRTQMTQRQEEEKLIEELAEFAEDYSQPVEARQVQGVARVANNQQGQGYGGSNNHQNNYQNRNQLNNGHENMNHNNHEEDEMNNNPITAEECNELLSLLYDDDD